MKSHAAVFAILCGLCLASPALAALHFGPYLQAMEPGSMDVCVAVDQGDVVEVRLQAADAAPVTASGDMPACARLTGLQPDRQYTYEVRVNGERVTSDPPPAFVTQGTAIQTFAIYGDTRSGDDSFDLAHGQIVGALQETTVPDAIIHTGDFVERGGDRRLWESFFRIEGDVLPATPIFPAIGRSDTPSALMRSIFPLLRKQAWYSFDRDDVHFAVLHLNQTARQDDAEVAPDGAQAQWLRADLAAARERGAKFLFVVIHEPPIDPAGQTPAAIRDVFMPILESFGVTAVFSGAHYFSHAVRGGVHYFTNGGGGASLDTRPAKPGVFRFFSPIHHFLVLEVGSFGARLQAHDAQGGIFYAATLTGADTEAAGLGAPTFVRHYAGGDASTAVTAFFRAKESELAALNRLLPEVARQAGVSLLVTFRSLDNADNRAALDVIADPFGAMPVVQVGERVLVGTEELAAGLADAVAQAATNPETVAGRAPQLAALAAGLAALVIVIVAVAWRRRSQ